MINFRKYKLWLTFILGTFILFSFQRDEDVFQDGLTKLKTSILNFKNLPNFSMDVKYSMFVNPQNFDTPYKSNKGKIIRNNSNFYQEEMGNLVIANSEYILRVNTRSEVISIENRKNLNMLPINFDIDSVSIVFERIKVIPKGYEYSFKNGLVSKMEILYSENNLMRTVRSYYSKQVDLGEGMVQVVTQLDYQNLNTRPSIANDLFSLDKYVKITNKVVTLNNKYVNYDLINKLK